MRQLQRLACAVAHRGAHLAMRRHHVAGEEAGQHRALHVQPRHVGEIDAEVAADDAQLAAQPVHLPAALSQHPHRRRFAGACERIQLACDQFDERGLAAAVRAEDRGVLAERDAQAQFVQHAHLAAHHAGAVQFDQWRGGRHGNCIGDGDGHGSETVLRSRARSG
jgi:hypothetical protein